MTAPTATPAPAAPVFYKRADPARLADPAAYLPPKRVGSVYVAALAQPLLIQTPPVIVTSPLTETHAHLRVESPDLIDFLRAAEHAVLQAAMASKDSWFGGRVTDDDALRASFREFCKPEGAVQVRVDPGAAVFDHQGALLAEPADWPGAAGRAKARCILELRGVRFGRTEFGAAWTIVQAQALPPPPPPPAPPAPPACLICPALEDAAEDDSAGQPAAAEAAEPGGGEAAEPGAGEDHGRDALEEDTGVECE